MTSANRNAVISADRTMTTQAIDRPIFARIALAVDDIDGHALPVGPKTSGEVIHVAGQVDAARRPRIPATMNGKSVPSKCVDVAQRPEPQPVVAPAHLIAP